MVMFNSYVTNYQRVGGVIPENPPVFIADRLDDWNSSWEWLSRDCTRPLRMKAFKKPSFLSGEG